MGTVTDDERTHAPSNDPELAQGTRVGEYIIERRLGKGGFGTVYLAVHPVIGKQVAIKVLARRFASDESIVSRFVAEARAVNQIRHHNIVDIFGFSQLPDGRHCYVMELLEGDSLERTIQLRAPIPLADALPIVRGIARALDAAHQNGIAHRDLKPENIMLVRDSEGRLSPKLLDFGIAKLLAPDTDVRHKTGTGVPIGTPYYMSPEQCRGRDVDHRTDLYSFGILLYRMLTGAYPFDGDYAELLFKQIHDEPMPPSSVNPAISPAVDHAIEWLMRKQPHERPSSALEAVAALDPAAGVTPAIPGPHANATRRDPVAVAAPTLMSPATTRIRRRRVGIVVGALGVVLAGGVVALVLASHDDTPAVAASGAVVISDAPPSVPIDAPLAVATPVDAPAAPTGHVIIQITGVPPNTEVSMGTKFLGLAPGPIQLERGSKAVVLTFTADGHYPKNVLLAPDTDRDQSVKLKARPRAKTPPPRGDRSREQTIDSNDLFRKGS